MVRTGQPHRDKIKVTSFSIYFYYAPETDEFATFRCSSWVRPYRVLAEREPTKSFMLIQTQTQIRTHTSVLIEGSFRYLGSSCSMNVVVDFFSYSLELIFAVDLLLQRKAKGH